MSRPATAAGRCGATTADAAAPVDLRSDVATLTPGLVALRRALHQHPELAFEEVRTAATLAGRLRALGLPVQEGIAGTGVLAVLDGTRPGPTLLLRADMDGLAMPDATGTAHASRIPGRSHACGHDVHAAIVTGVAEVLVRHRDRLAGRVAIVFQPADEPMLGARRMIEAGLLERVRPDASLAVHVLPMAQVGQAVVQAGPIWASRDELTLSVEAAPAPPDGAAAPVDFPRTAARIATALYDLVEAEGGSAEPVTFRVRSLEADQPGPVWLGGTRGEARAAVTVNLALYDNALRARLLERIHEVAGAVARAAGGTLRVEASHALPALVNDPGVTAVVEAAARRALGPAGVLSGGWRHPFSDDFGLFMAAAPGCLVLLGTANPDKGITEIWHRPGFDIDEAALPLGVEILALAALDLLR
jgi:amidohydrolase